MTYSVIKASIEETEGGVRPEKIQSFSCEKECRGTPTTFWYDYAIFIPENSDDDFSPGYCELRSTLYEVIFCKRKDNKPFPPCSIASRILADEAIAVKYVNGEITCHKQYFKPFHRSASEDDITMTEDDAFGDQIGGGYTRYYHIARNFVQNFDPDDMTISGASWLSLRAGKLIGKPPRSGATTRYDFVISAHNRMGSDDVSLGIIVNP